eukprot:737587_1
MSLNMTTSTWKEYVNVVMALGFKKATIISRSTNETLASSTRYDIATIWTGSDSIDGKECDINENEELLDDWKSIKRSTFCFYGKRFRIVLRGDDPDPNERKRQDNLLTYGYIEQADLIWDIPDDVTKLISTYIFCSIDYDKKRLESIESTRVCNYIVGLKNKEIIIAYQFKTIWFIVCGSKRNRGDRTSNNFYGAQDAWNQVSNNCFEYIEECGV